MSVKISELTASSAVTSNDFVPIVDYETATTKRASANQVLNYITGSTFNSLTVTSLTSSNVTASRIDVDQIYVNDVIGGNISGDAAGLTNIPASGIEGSIQYNVSGVLTGDSYLTYDSENLKLISQNADFISVTVDDISGTTAQFTTITSSNLVVSGGNAIFYEMAEIGDNAYVLYNSSIDKLAVFPGLYVTGAITASTALSASNIGATTAIFSVVSASSYLGIPSSSIELTKLTVSSSISLSSTQRAVFAKNNISSSISITLPSVSVADSKEYYITKADSITGSVIISGSSPNLINGQATYELNGPYQAVTLIHDGSDWYIF